MEYRPGKIGVEIRGIDLKKNVPEEIIDQIKKDVHVHKLLIFKNQGVISGERHAEISQWFGELESTFYKHERSTHPDVFRVSNDSAEGCRGVGRTGWHIDGSFMKQPFRFAIYHMVSVPREGSTAFISLNDLINRLSREKREKWDSLWMVSNGHYDIIHPLIYPHPSTGQPTMCFHLGMIAEIVSDVGHFNERVFDYDETKAVLQDIYTEINKNKDLIYTHQWEEGDFIISDNLAVGHEATPETQYPVSQVGLRVLHRTTIKGVNTPSKT
ncbi:hypothetical protein SNE40_012589 [Patella caerulea]|uniref:TauD/TfdA-like domain-containing protein n=1 Tax=Patella caerulea TaxID=87958 RepID=A0AAN8JPT1_PATCE